MRLESVHWEGVTSVAAVASVVVALVFNGLQMSSVSQQTKLARQATELQTTQIRLAGQATELQLLTDLHGLVTNSYVALDRVGVPLQKAIDRRSYRLPYGPRGRVAAAFDDREYLAYLFNRRFINLKGARELWGPLLSCSYRNILVWLYKNHSFGPGGRIATDYPNLQRFARSMKCPG